MKSSEKSLMLETEFSGRNIESVSVNDSSRYFGCLMRMAMEARLWASQEKLASWPRRQTSQTVRGLMSGFPGHFILETEDLVKMDCLTSDQQNKINCLQLHESHVIVVNFFLLGI